MDSKVLKNPIVKAIDIVKKRISGVEVQSNKWISKQAAKFEEKADRELKVEINTNITKRKSLVQESIQIDFAINNLLEKEKHTIKNLLVIKNPYKYAPLCAMALFNTKNPCAVKVTVKGKTKDVDVEYTIPSALKHRVPIMGLYDDYNNKVVIEVLDKNENILTSKTFNLYVEPLKERQPTIEPAEKKSNQKYLYDFTLVYGGDDGVYPYAFDRNGDIRFTFAMVPKTYGFQPISNGRFLLLNRRVTRHTATNPASTQMIEVDQIGRFHRIYNVEKGAHHDFVELDNDNLVVGCNSIDGNTYEDTVVEINRITGDVLNEIKIKDYIDSKYVSSADWAHLNSIEYDKDEKTAMVSLRNLHAVLKVNYETKELLWILGHPDFWKDSAMSNKVLKPVGDNMEWFFQQHAAYFIDKDLDGNPDTKHLIMYDNHTQKRRPVSYYDKEKESFVRIYTINEKEKEVSLFKSFECERSGIRSNAIFEADAQRVMAMSGKLHPNSKKHKSMIKEFDYKTGKVLNEIYFSDGFYRAYEFKFAADKMAQKMLGSIDYVLGKVYEMSQSERIDVSKAKKLPEKVLESSYKTEVERRKKLNELVKKDSNYYVDPEQDIARIEFVIEDDVLYVTLLDHLLEKIYFVGKENTYVRNFSDTKQERPEYFARAINVDPIPLRNLNEDKYEIFMQHKIGLYESGFKIEIK